MILALATAALAEPPRAEVLAGWSGSANATYGYATVQPALLRTDGGSVILKGTVSRATASWLEGEDRADLEASGLSVGPALVRSFGDLSLAVGLGLGARRASTRVAGLLRDEEVSFDTTLTSDLFFRPGQRASLYTQLALGAAGPSLWVRSGATCPITPRDEALSLWIGAEGTTVGSPSSLATEVGPVAEVPIRPLGASVSFRASTPAADLGRGVVVGDRTTVGAAVYWAYAPRR